MEQVVGTCSICGGDVVGVRGGWYSVNPPPPDKCSHCGAISAYGKRIIPMVPAPPVPTRNSNGLRKPILNDPEI